MLLSTPPPNTLHYHPTILLASSICGETLVWWVPQKWSSSRLLRSFPPPSIYPSSVASQGGRGYECPFFPLCLPLWPDIVWGCCQTPDSSPDPSCQQGTLSFHFEHPFSTARTCAPGLAWLAWEWVTGLAELAVSASRSDTRAVCGALITLMWGLGHEALLLRGRMPCRPWERAALQRKGGSSST